jgi:hypothetical protein
MGQSLIVDFDALLERSNKRKSRSSIRLADISSLWDGDEGSSYRGLGKTSRLLNAVHPPEEGTWTRWAQIGQRL